MYKKFAHVLAVLPVAVEFWENETLNIYINLKGWNTQYACNKGYYNLLET